MPDYDDISEIRREEMTKNWQQDVAKLFKNNMSNEVKSDNLKDIAKELRDREIGY